ncbi:DinB family protein [Acidicapsa ligni]|uniref:DinB family protein n=1 Tax=Acidicapsa ligni TaxID=542300 RepID=UPI0021DF52DD|nr:DinB family protein [Acidicapsa ligni]
MTEHVAVNDKALREQLVKLLMSEEAHASYEKAVAGMPFELAGMKPDGAPHSAWEELEHLRITLWDILEFSRDAKHVSPAWPEGYWPKSSAPKAADDWHESVKKYRADMKAMVTLVRDEKTDLFAKIPHGDGQTVLREALLAADHTAYHVGQLVLLRKMLGVWG